MYGCVRGHTHNMYMQCIQLLCLQRSDIVLGSYEPSDKECEWNLDEADDDGAVSPKIVEIKEDGETAISGLTVCSCKFVVGPLKH